MPSHYFHVQVSICSIFAGDGDVTSCISYAADSIGIEMPIFEHLKYDPYDWIKRTQVELLLFCYSHCFLMFKF